jgi:hypothetical protein
VIFGNAQGTYLEHSKTPLYGIIITEIALIFLNKIFKNPLLDIVNLVFVIFFLMRVPFVYSDYLISDIYLRGVNIDKVSNSLYVLNFELIVLSLCILFFKPVLAYRGVLKGSNELFHKVLSFVIIILLLNCIYVGYFFVLGVNYLPSVIQIFFALFNWGSVLILIVPLLLLVNDNVSIKYRVMLYIELIICIFLVMYTGSKSGLFQIAGIYLISLLAIRGASYRITPLTMLITLIILFAAVGMYFLGDIFNKIQRGQVEFSEWYEVFSASLDNFLVILNSFSFRVGYLDFYIDKHTQEIYFNAFQIKFYIMAFIDAITPGFDVWGDVPLVSRAVYNNYFGMSDGPNSEVVTVFAEAHHLAGYFSVVTYLFVLWIIFLIRKYFFDMRSNYGRYMQSIFICYIFYRYMLGIGIDYWFFGDVIYPLLFVILSLKFMKWSRNKC